MLLINQVSLFVIIIDASVHGWLHQSWLLSTVTFFSLAIVCIKLILETEEMGVDSEGKINYYHVCKFPIRHKQKNILVGGVAMDITERHQSKSDLQEAKEKYKCLVDEIGHQFLVYSYDSSLNVKLLSI